jgi:nitroreductase
VGAIGAADPIASAPIVAILTSTFWRNAWKYRARAYRHAFWDSGAVLANLLELTAADATPTSVLMGFADDRVNALVGADGSREAAVAVVAIGDGATAPGDMTLDELRHSTLPLSARELAYPEIQNAHAASALASDEVKLWRRRAGPILHAVGPRTFDPPPDDTIARRRSTRRFSGERIERAALEALITAATAPIPGDSFAPVPVEPFLIVNAVDGLDPGTYRSDLTPIRLGDVRDLAGGLALWQELAAMAAVNVYWLADLEATLGRLGERGYRVAQMAGGIAGGRVELAATALGLGGTGLTFFDDEVTAVFEPAARGRQVMYLAAAGRRAGR